MILTKEYAFWFKYIEHPTLEMCKEALKQNMFVCIDVPDEFHKELGICLLATSHGSRLFQYQNKYISDAYDCMSAWSLNDVLDFCNNDTVKERGNCFKKAINNLNCK